MIGITIMTRMVRELVDFVSARVDPSDRGATAVEYGLIVALIAAVIIGMVTLVGGDVLDAFTGVHDEMPAP